MLFMQIPFSSRSSFSIRPLGNFSTFTTPKRILPRRFLLELNNVCHESGNRLGAKKLEGGSYTKA